MTHPADASPLLALAADYWDVFLETNPVFATAVGDPRFDAILPDPSAAAQAAARARYEALMTRLDALPPAAAENAREDSADADEVTRSALRESIAGDLALIDTGLSAWNVDPLDGVPVLLLQVAEIQRSDSPVARAAMVERWRAAGPFVDAHIEALRGGLAAGFQPCAAPVDRVIDLVAGLLARPDDTWPFLAAVADPDATRDATPEERERFAEALRAAVAGTIRPALARLHDALATDVRPVARPPERPGLCHLPGGEAAYRRLIRVHTSLDLTPDELHQTGLAEIERIDAEMEDLAARVLGTRSRAEAVARLRADSSLHFTTRDEVRAKAEDTLARANAAVPAWFGRLPRTQCEVVTMPPHEEEHSSIAYYLNPAEDGSRPGQFYINTAHPETRPRYEAEVLAFHESVPGHHLQIALAQELPELPAFRRNLGPTAFFEGWGLYTERLADEMGLYSGDLDRIGVLSFDAWRASRLVVDTGMHDRGWTRQQAIDFMTEHTALAPNNIANEVDRYIVIPGQALAYKTGQLELLRLRAEARERLGEAFDVRAFHDTVLGNGPIALPTLRAIVQAWIARVAAGR
jgi:uncharacterized protein (DUF885 family)